MCHPGGGVKEQTAGMYAEKLAEFGYVTVVYDASHQGESEGSPKYLEDPFARTEDVRASVDYLTTLDFVDNGRMVALVFVLVGVIQSVQQELNVVSKH